MLGALTSAAELRTAARKPLTRRSATKAPEIKLLNPRFEEEYAAGEPGFCPSPERLLPLVTTSHAEGHYKSALAHSHQASIMHQSVPALYLGVTRAAGVQGRTTTRTGSAARPSGCGGSCRRSAAAPCASCARTPPSSARCGACSPHLTRPLPAPYHTLNIAVSPLVVLQAAQGYHMHAPCVMPTYDG